MVKGVNIADEEQIEDYVLGKNMPFLYGYTLFTADELVDHGWAWQVVNFNNDGITILGLDMGEGLLTDEIKFIPYDNILGIYLEPKRTVEILRIETTEDFIIEIEEYASPYNAKRISSEIKQPILTFNIRKKVINIGWQGENLQRVEEFVESLG